MCKQYLKCPCCIDGYVIDSKTDERKDCLNCGSSGWKLDSSVDKEEIVEIHDDLSVDLSEIYVESFKCPRCGESWILNGFSYCPMCGQRIEVKGGRDDVYMPGGRK